MEPTGTDSVDKKVDKAEQKTTPTAKRPRLDRSSLKKHATLFNRGQARHGFVVTCAVHRENHALAQVLQLLNHYARKFYPEEVERHLNPPAPTEGDAGGTAADARPDGTAAEEPSSADSAETLKLADSNTAAAADSKEETGTSHGPTPPSDKPRERAPKLFNIFDSGGISGLFFVSVNSPDIRPVEFAHRIFTDPDFPQQAAHSDACHRLVPIERVCAASEADIVSAAQAMLPDHFPSETDAPLKFAVVFDKRNNDRVERMPVVSQIAASVPPVHSVDLSTPHKVVLVYIFKSACGLSVTSDYHAFAKYNLHSTAARRSGSTTMTTN